MPEEKNNGDKNQLTPSNEAHLPMSHYQHLPKPSRIRKYLLVMLIPLLPLGLLLVYLASNFVLSLFFVETHDDLIPVLVTPIPTQSAVSTANWPMYTDSQNGFSLHYPETWSEIRDGKNHVGFSPPPDPGCLPPNGCGGVPAQVTVQILEDEGMELEEFIENYKTSNVLWDPENREDENIDALVQAGIPRDSIGALYSGGMCINEYIFIAHESQIIMFDFQCVDPTIPTHMLSTFKFIDTNTFPTAEPTYF